MREILRELFRRKKVQTENELDSQMVDAYREVFSSQTGRRVLTHMLGELNFFNEEVSETEEVVLSNYARHLLANIGVYSYVNLMDLDLINAFMDIPLRDFDGLRVTERKGWDLINKEGD